MMIAWHSELEIMSTHDEAGYHPVVDGLVFLNMSFATEAEATERSMEIAPQTD